MAKNWGIIATAATKNALFTAAAATGAATAFSSALEEADFDIYKNGSNVQRSSTAGFTATSGFDSVTGVYNIAVDFNDNTDAGFYSAGADLEVLLTPDETLDSVTIAAVVAYGTLEPASTRAVRLLQESFYPTAPVVATTTNNSTSSINLTEIVDAQQTIMAGEILGVRDISNDQTIYVRVTAFTYPQATVETLAGAAMPFTVAAGDYIWRMGQFTALTGSIAAIATASSINNLQPALPPTNTAYANIPFVMVSTIGTAVTGLTPTVTRSIDGGAFASATGTVAEVGNGLYQFDASQADMNGGKITFRFVGTGAVDVFRTIQTDADF